jgi:hypothetical protein
MSPCLRPPMEYPNLEVLLHQDLEQCIKLSSRPSHDRNSGNLMRPRTARLPLMLHMYADQAGDYFAIISLEEKERDKQLNDCLSWEENIANIPRYLAQNDGLLLLSPSSRRKYVVLRM